MNLNPSQPPNPQHPQPSAEVVDGLDHRSLIQAYDLGHIEPHSPGLIHWHRNGVRVLRHLEGFVRGLHLRHGYEEVRSPALLSRHLWERSGHWDKYRELMFVAQGPDGEDGYAVKPMSCPGHISIYQHQRRSYRDLPLKLFEFGQVHRREPSGALSGWLRLRGFTQDDSHVFADIAQLPKVIDGFVDMVGEAYQAFGFSKWRWRLSLRPENRAGGDALWDEAEERMRQACDSMGLEVEVAPGEGAFYGPKLEVVLEDRLGRSWQCGVVQLDFVLPERFGMAYQGEDGRADHRPVLIHHAVLGSLERWIAISLEHNGWLPDWMAPVVVGVCPVGAEQELAARELARDLEAAGVHAMVLANNPLGGRLRDLAKAKVPVWAVLGPKEVAQHAVSVRRHDGKAIVCDAQGWVERMARCQNNRRPWRP